MDIEKLLLYRDALMLIINKPKGIPVHSGSGGGDNLEKHFDALRFGLPKIPSLAHRLDRDTSGCLILGRHHKALRKLGKLFSSGEVKKTYWAVVVGEPPNSEGVIDIPLFKKNSKKTGWQMIASKEGQQSITHYKLKESKNGLSWLELFPQTGRTHQIRVHCAEIGCPVLGDNQYGRVFVEKPNATLHLHSRAIEVPLYPKKPIIRVEAPPPRHMVDTLNQLNSTNLFDHD